MRFSAITTLCAAPLALAASLQADLVARGALRAEARNGKANNNNAGTIKASTQIDEIIVIWVNPGAGAATTTVTQVQTVAAAAAAQATHTVTVGGAAGLVYTPDTLVAAVGDMVVFNFLSTNHTVTQSSFDLPCEPLAGGINSGFQPNVNGSVVPAPQVAMQVTVSTPIWMYCAQKAHCGKGMVFSINPVAAKTQAMFQSAAIAQNGTGAIAPIVGGAAAPASSSVVTPPASVATTAAAAQGTSVANTGSIVAGTGTVNAGGACACSCLCTTGSFPNAAIQGVAAFGGMAGSMPFSALES